MKYKIIAGSVDSQVEKELNEFATKVHIIKIHYVYSGDKYKFSHSLLIEYKEF